MKGWFFSDGEGVEAGISKEGMPAGHFRAICRVIHSAIAGGTAVAVVRFGTISHLIVIAVAAFLITLVVMMERN